MEFWVVSEEELDSERVDGAIYTPHLNGNRILLQDSGKELPLARLEVKTGKSVKVLQCASYAFQDGVPVILAEVPVSMAHLIDCETSEKLLRFAKNQINSLNELRGEGKRIPDGYRCASCGNVRCPHQTDNGHGKYTSLIKDRADQLIENTKTIAEEITDIIKELAEEKGFQVGASESKKFESLSGGRLK
ncbi:hypothetical protein AKJ54_01080 [candidate division MSBL1 archaeon SCGC-AAA382K21]|uniref:Uncharacterized protein n=1 Tax=candidate division MSBL1 archaeon SCGC-AAA382K21 TaxID=1698283 RepID=A0A133VK46_9EURY|nr:hypothetical protein AKJ54_01080 [candidate division MSBL1 archaeon SCGC-AAA382K21]